MSLRVFAPTGSAPCPGERLLLCRDESRYLRRVRRARDGAKIELLDGCGGLWAATIEADKGRSTVLLVGEPLAIANMQRRLTLLLGLPEAAATLQTITQATELGVAKIVLVRCARSQGRVPSRDRIDRVLRSALRQCGRPRPPEVIHARTLDEALSTDPDTPAFFADTALRGQLDPHMTLGRAARLLIGPEGGLTDHEIQTTREQGW
ncbi:MAG TPA: RsmE family RNA methyltransferase, partial [Nannocystis exedens]|nr:RsmE family RNA methyltransferase [Nannocystis exedens]